MSEGVNSFVEVPWLGNFEHAEVCVNCKPGIEIEESGHHQAETAPKRPQVPVPFRH